MVVMVTKIQPTIILKDPVQSKNLSLKLGRFIVNLLTKLDFALITSSGYKNILFQERYLRQIEIILITNNNYVKNFKIKSTVKIL